MPKLRRYFPAKPKLWYIVTASGSCAYVDDEADLRSLATFYEKREIEYAVYRLDRTHGPGQAR